MRSNRFLLMPAFFLLLFAACKSDPKTPEFAQSMLTGRWEIDKAWRNGKQTETLTGTYYEFGENGEMRTNLTPTLVEDEFSYEYSDNVIEQKSEPPVTYTIENLTDSLLVFSMKINNFPFRLQLKKAMPPANETPPSTDTL
jgi:hypothetical protein